MFKPSTELDQVDQNDFISLFGWYLKFVNKNLGMEKKLYQILGQKLGSLTARLVLPMLECKFYCIKCFGYFSGWCWCCCVVVDNIANSVSIATAIVNWNWAWQHSSINNKYGAWWCPVNQWEVSKCYSLINANKSSWYHHKGQRFEPITTLVT